MKDAAVLASIITANAALRRAINVGDPAGITAASERLVHVLRDVGMDAPDAERYVTSAAVQYRDRRPGYLRTPRIY